MFAPITVDKSPAQISTLTVDKKQALVKNAAVLNLGGKKIIAYQIGWVAGNSPKDANVTVSPMFEVPAGIDPGSETEVPAQPFSPSIVKPGIRVAFFVAKVRFSDGTAWAADLKALQKKALANGVETPNIRLKNKQL